jgi:hypothetical protein
MGNCFLICPSHVREKAIKCNSHSSIIIEEKEEAKGTWNSPSPNYYQTVVLRVSHICMVTRSNFGVKEESPYKPESLEHGAMFLIAWN